MRPHRAALIFITLAALIPASTFAADSADENAVKQLVAKYAAARESRDAAVIETLFTDDADQLVSSGVWRRGREELVKGMLGSSSRNPGERTITVETVRFPSSDIGIADARYVIAGQDGAEPRRMWSTFIAVRTPDGWRLAAIRNMLPAR